MARMCRKGIHPMEGDNLAPNGGGRLVCRACRREKKGVTQLSMSERTHCPSGHPYDEENTAIRQGARHCRACESRRGSVAYQQRMTDDPQFSRRQWLRNSYGITLEQYEEMVDRQHGECAICRNQPDDALCVDHDHDTGEIRGLLCRRCNLGLGYFKDDPDRLAQAMTYLKEQVPSHA